jgi:predicted phosphodiesterase
MSKHTMTVDPLGNIEVFGYDGVLSIGDTHIAERTGRRIDAYSTAILGKLDQAADVAIERNLFPVHLGDLFNRARENSLELLARTAAVLERFPLPTGASVKATSLGLPVVVGSHDPVETSLTDKDALQLLATFGRVFPMGTPGKVLTLVLNSGERVGLWVTPAGARVPDHIDAEPGTVNIMFTHHDFDFNGLYPDAHELHEIEGCDLMINGHMHKATSMVLKGRTACHNPGSLARVKIDERNHKPVVSVWTPAHGLSLEPVLITAAENVFDMTGKEVYAADARTLKADLPKGLSLSRFAAKYRARDALEAGRTDDGSVLIEELDGYLKMFDKPDNLKRYLTGLVGQVVAERTGAPV